MIVKEYFNSNEVTPNNQEEVIILVAGKEIPATFGEAYNGVVWGFKIKENEYYFGDVKWRYTD